MPGEPSELPQICMAMLSTRGGSSLVPIMLGAALHEKGYPVRFTHANAKTGPLHWGDYRPQTRVLANPVSEHAERILDTDRTFFSGVEVVNQLVEWFDEAPCDILHLHNLQVFGLPALLLHQWHGIPYVVTLHGSDILDDRLFPKNATVLTEVLRHAARVTCVSEFLKDALLEQVPDVAHVEVVHNFLRPAFQSRRTEVPRDPATFLHVSSFRPVKRPELLLRAFEIVLETVPEARLRIVTSGRGIERAYYLVSQFDFADRVTILEGTEDTLPDEYARATAAVLTSRFEAFCLVILEALSQGTPVVVPAVGGIPEVVGEDWPLLVNARTCDPSCYAERMIRVMEETQANPRWLDPAPILDKFDPHVKVAQYEAIYRNVPAARSAPASSR